MNYKNFLLLALLSLGLTGCVSAPKNMSAGQALTAGEGIVVTKLRSNWTGYDNPLLANIEFIFGKAGSNVNSGKFVMTKANDLKVISLPAGDYRWSHLSFGNRHLDFNRIDGFKIEAGKIVYIGDLNSVLELGAFSATGRFWVTNDVKNIKDEMKIHYPELIKKYPFVEKVTRLSAE